MVRAISSRRRHGLGLVAALVLLALAPAAHARVGLVLRFDGRPVEPTAPVDVTCFDEGRGQWVGCRTTKAGEPGTWWLDGLPAGRYRLHVSVDENPANPRRYPGDYEAQTTVDVTDTGTAPIVVDLARLIHLTRPGDNARSLEGMLLGCASQPRFETPRLAWSPSARVETAWDPVVPGAEYRYWVSIRSCTGGGGERALTAGKTPATVVPLTLPPSAGGEHYVFRVEAWRDGRLVGDLYTHDGGAHSWNYRFQVVDRSLPRWVWIATGGGLLLLLLATRRVLGGADAARRRRRLGWVAGGALVVVAAGALGLSGYQYLHERARQRLEAERAVAEAARQARQREFVAAFASAAPRPAWWDDVRTPYRVDSVGDLLSAWQGHPRSEEGERQFFKAAYQGVVDHPDDEHVVATAIDLLFWVVRDYPHRLSLARFGYERYFHHRRRTDNCADCMAGDTTQGLAVALSTLSIEAGRLDDAIAACRRLIDERGAEVSPYKLAEVWSQLAWAHWRKGERGRALALVREGLERYGDTVGGDALRRTLAAFEREGVVAPR
jgi:hypothetical protein